MSIPGLLHAVASLMGPRWLRARRAAAAPGAQGCSVEALEPRALLSAGSPAAGLWPVPGAAVVLDRSFWEPPAGAHLELIAHN
jgi:hypothetical protein